MLFEWQPFQPLPITKITHDDVLLIPIARAAIAQLGERQTEDLKVPGSIPGLGISFFSAWRVCLSPFLKVCVS